MADDLIRDVPSRHPDPAGTRFGDITFGKVSWSAIWAGVMVTVGMEALFLSFGVFIGAIMGGSTPWTMAWYLVTMAISFYAGAWCAARLADVPIREICILHGLSMWGLATLATIVTGVVVGWAVTVLVRGGIGLTTVTAATVWSRLEEWGGVIWGGILLSLVGAYFGSASLAPAPRPRSQQETPSVPGVRRAS